jgi:hypothetical protein
VALKAVLENLDSVDAAFHDLYAEKDGKFILQIDGIRDHPDTVALRNALDRVRKEKSDVKVELDGVKTRLVGLPEEFDAAAYDALKAQADAAGDKTPDERIARNNEAWQAKLDAQLAKSRDSDAALKKENLELRAGRERDAIDRNLAAAMAEANIDPAHRETLTPYLRTKGKIKVVEEGGVQTVLVDSDMGEVPLSKFVSDWAGSDAGKPYVRKPTGLDTNGSDQRRIDGNPFSAQNWNKTEQGRMLKTDRGKAERFAKAAGFRTLEAATSSSTPIAK